MTSRLIPGINGDSKEERGKRRGRPPIKRDAIYIVRKELEAISRYGQFRLRGINYRIEMVETEDEISLRITVPLKQFPLADISESIAEQGGEQRG